MPQHRALAAGPGGPAGQGLVARVAGREGPARDVPAGLHAEAPDEGHGAAAGVGAGRRRARRLPALTHEGPAASRRAFASSVRPISRR
ncbi:MAG: hypothetical protein DMD96_32480 [Candidatus Rokuibacteriota bacterium]|nr:MAG: hypothetical protein DMD96_32480 [Candidatus Rokubacteria bacterium]